MNRNQEKFKKSQLLRKKGISIRAIAKKLCISTSTASIWCRNIKLTDQQQDILRTKGIHVELLMKYAARKHEERLIKHDSIFESANKEISRLNKNELFLVGLSLYWAEGFKSPKERRIGFCNSDPKMISFMMHWFKNSLNIPNSDFTLRAEFNISHKERLDEIENYWSNLTNIPKIQFNAPYFQKVNQVRDYSNRSNYYGILRIRIRKSSDLLVKLRGWIEGLSRSYYS